MQKSDIVEVIDSSFSLMYDTKDGSLCSKHLRPHEKWIIICVGEQFPTHNGCVNCKPKSFFNNLMIRPIDDTSKILFTHTKFCRKYYSMELLSIQRNDRRE
jgi:hypothetical protein